MSYNIDTKKGYLVHLKKIHEGNLWRAHKIAISFILTEQIFLYFCCYRDRFYNRYMNETDKKIILIMMVLE